MTVPALISDVSKTMNNQNQVVLCVSANTNNNDNNSMHTDTSNPQPTNRLYHDTADTNQFPVKNDSHRHLQPYKHDYTYYITEFVFGGIAGLTTGYTIKLFGRLVLICSIGSIVGIQYLIYYEYLQINWVRVNHNLKQLQRFASVIIHEQLTNNQLINADTDITDTNWLVTQSSNLLDKLLKLAGSQILTAAGAGFTVGMIVGLKRG